MNTPWNERNKGRKEEEEEGKEGKNWEGSKEGKREKKIPIFIISKNVFFFFEETNNRTIHDFELENVQRQNNKDTGHVLNQQGYTAGMDGRVKYHNVDW